MNKRGQFFIITAFILIGIIIGLSKVSNYVLLPSTPENVKEINNEIDREAMAAMDYSLNNNLDAKKYMENFSISYAAYLRSKVNDSQLFFLYTDQNKTWVFAYGDSSQIGAKMKTNPFVLSGLGDYLSGSQDRNLSNNENQTNATFYGNTYIFNMQLQDYYHIVRVKDGDKIFVAS